VQPADGDEVRQVRDGQRGRCERGEQRRLEREREPRRLPALGDAHVERREEDDRRVEVQQGGDERREDPQAPEIAPAPGHDLGELLEQAVAVEHDRHRHGQQHERERGEQGPDGVLGDGRRGDPAREGDAGEHHRGEPLHRSQARREQAGDSGDEQPDADDGVHRPSSSSRRSPARVPAFIADPVRRGPRPPQSHPTRPGDLVERAPRGRSREFVRPSCAVHRPLAVASSATATI